MACWLGSTVDFANLAIFHYTRDGLQIMISDSRKGILDKNSNTRNRSTFFWFATVAAPLLWVILAFLPLLSLRSGWFTLSESGEYERFPLILEQLGTFGDMFGALNCLFSGAAFIGVAYTISLQQRQIAIPERQLKDSEWSASRQIYLSAYRDLANYHQYELQNAGSDFLLAARSKGRIRAFSELTTNLLRVEESSINGGGSSQPNAGYLHDHPARIRNLIYEFNVERQRLDHNRLQYPVWFHPVRTLLSSLVEEIAALTELVKENVAVQADLLEAGHAVNAACNPDGLYKPTENVEQFRKKNAETAFECAQRILQLIEPQSKKVSVE